MKLLWGEPGQEGRELSDGDLLMLIVVLAIAMLLIGIEFFPAVREALHGTLIGNHGWASGPGALMPDFFHGFDPWGWMIDWAR